MFNIQKNPNLSRQLLSLSSRSKTFSLFWFHTWNPLKSCWLLFSLFALCEVLVPTLLGPHGKHFVQKIKNNNIKSLQCWEKHSTKICVVVGSEGFFNSLLSNLICCSQICILNKTFKFLSTFVKMYTRYKTSKTLLIYRMFQCKRSIKKKNKLVVKRSPDTQ